MNKKWTIDNITSKLQLLLLELGHIPTQQQLRKIGLGGLARAIDKNGGLHYFYQLLNINHNRNIPGYWKNFENVSNALLPIIIDNCFPTTCLISTMPKGSQILKAIYNYHGGIASVAKKMNCYLERYMAPDGHFVQSGNEYIFDAFLSSRNIPHEVHVKIGNTNYACDFKINNIYFEIWGFGHSNNSRHIQYRETRKIKEKLYKNLQLQLVSIESNVFRLPPKQLEEYFISLMKQLNISESNINASYNITNSIKGCRYWNEDKVILHLKELMDSNNQLSSHSELIKKHPGLQDAISRHGGIVYFRKLLGIPETKKANKYWNQETIVKNLEYIIKELHHFPKMDDIKQMNRTDLFYAIRHHGGINKFRSLFNYPIKKYKYWNEQTIIDQLLDAINHLKKFPTSGDLSKINRKDLARAIKTFGGFNKFKSLIEVISSSAFSSQPVSSLKPFCP